MIDWRLRLPHRSLGLTDWDDALHDHVLGCTWSYNELVRDEPPGSACPPAAR